MQDNKNSPYWFVPFAKALESYPSVENVRFLSLSKDDTKDWPTVYRYGMSRNSLPDNYYEAYCFFECRSRKSLWAISKLLGETTLDSENQSEFDPMDVLVSPYEEDEDHFDIEFCIVLYPDEEHCELNIPVITKRLLELKQSLNF